jgi:hypothetical protein
MELSTILNIVIPRFIITSIVNAIYFFRPLKKSISFLDIKPLQGSSIWKDICDRLDTRLGMQIDALFIFVPISLGCNIRNLVPRVFNQGIDFQILLRLTQSSESSDSLL